MPTVLSIAEKPSVARELARILSGAGPGGALPPSRRGRSSFNPIFFPFRCDAGPALGGAVDMVVSSVTGHLKEMEFAAPYE